MKIFLKALAKQFSGSIDSVLSILIVPIAFLLLAYRRLGAAKLPKTTGRLKRIGVFPLRNRYYEPLFDDAKLRACLPQSTGDWELAIESLMPVLAE